MEIIICENKQKVAEVFSLELKKMINNQEVFHIALSGGSTPKVVFDYLASDFGTSINWNNAHFYWGDERCVKPSDSESNYKMTVEHLFSKIDIPFQNVNRIMGENAPESEALRYSELLETELGTINGVPVFDLVILGMGDDGHTASIFPHQMELWSSSSTCEVAIHPQSGQKRISLTGKVINRAKKVVFLVTGSSKKEKIDEIVNKKDGYLQYPAAHVQPFSKNLQWFLDKEAAELIDVQ